MTEKERTNMLKVVDKTNTSHLALVTLIKNKHAVGVASFFDPLNKLIDAVTANRKGISQDE